MPFLTRKWHVFDVKTACFWCINGIVMMQKSHVLRAKNAWNFDLSTVSPKGEKQFALCTEIPFMNYLIFVWKNDFYLKDVWYLFENYLISIYENIWTFFVTTIRTSPSPFITTIQASSSLFIITIQTSSSPLGEVRERSMMIFCGGSNVTVRVSKNQ